MCRAPARHTARRPHIACHTRSGGNRGLLYRPDASGRRAARAGPWRAPSGVRHAAMKSGRYGRPLPVWRRERPIPLAQMSEWVLRKSLTRIEQVACVRWSCGGLRRAGFAPPLGGSAQRAPFMVFGLCPGGRALLLWRGVPCGQGRGRQGVGGRAASLGLLFPWTGRRRGRVRCGPPRRWGQDA